MRVCVLPQSISPNSVSYVVLQALLVSSVIVLFRHFDSVPSHPSMLFLDLVISSTCRCRLRPRVERHQAADLPRHGPLQLPLLLPLDDVRNVTTSRPTAPSRPDLPHRSPGHLESRSIAGPGHISAHGRANRGRVLSSRHVTYPVTHLYNPR